MVKRFLSICLLCMLTLALFGFLAQYSFNTGIGTPQDEYVVMPFQQFMYYMSTIRIEPTSLMALNSLINDIEKLASIFNGFDFTNIWNIIDLLKSFMNLLLSPLILLVSTISEVLRLSQALLNLLFLLLRIL